MTTPNIEWLIGHLRSFSGTSLAPALMHQAADTLQSQEERIAKLERESETHSKAYGLAIVERDNLRHELKTAQEGWRCECSTDDACRFARERDALRAELGDLPEAQAEMLAEIKQLRAQLAEIAATEPAGWFKYDKVSQCWHPQYDDYAETHALKESWKQLFIRPMPAQDVKELVDAVTCLLQLIRREAPHLSGKVMGFAAAAIANAKGAK